MSSRDHDRNWPNSKRCTDIQPSRPPRDKSMQYARAFAGLFLRDLYVLRRELFPFVIRVCMNPLLFLFVFTYVMPHMSGGAAMNPTASMAGDRRRLLSTVLLPGLMAVAIMFSGIAAVALRLRRSSASPARSTTASCARCPSPPSPSRRSSSPPCRASSPHASSSRWPTTSLPRRCVAHVTSWFFLIVVLILASLTAGALGLTIGTSVKPQQIGLIFGVVVMPITFLGCVYYPWAALTHIRWLQIGVLINPIVYMSEGLRAALTPLPHMPPVLILTMLCVVFLCPSHGSVSEDSSAASSATSKAETTSAIQLCSSSSLKILSATADFRPTSSMSHAPSSTQAPTRRI
jgi:ABC-2 type transport system permease protein